ncbi:MAG: hypothetical protein K6U80_02925 [Firmicutes bacterium]|nr:hypothetical protein [Bacillota bacterium]
MKRLILLAILVLAVSSGIGAFAAAAPTLSLDIMVVATAQPGMNAVYFTAKLSPMTASAQPITIDFYNGSPILTVYPYNYLGSALMDNTGKAQLRIANHKSGTFAGGAIWAQSPWGKIFAPVKIYTVP